ncbi:hypothetical protein [Bacillus tropicus]|uniref:hypothetical protein n=1 Tax=Bacillus tropicus TaxID=2026188 RepID=UPI003D9A389F
MGKLTKKTQKRVDELSDVLDVLIGREGLNFEGVAFGKGLQLIMHKQFGRLNVLLAKRNELYDMDVLFSMDAVEEHVPLVHEHDSSDIESIVAKIKKAIQTVEDIEKSVA